MRRCCDNKLVPTPYPKNPLIANFFTAMGRSDTIGSGVKNLYKYTPIYSGGGNPELYEADVFRISIPLTKEAVKQVEMETELTEREKLMYDKKDSLWKLK